MRENFHFYVNIDSKIYVQSNKNTEWSFVRKNLMSKLKNMVQL